MDNNGTTGTIAACLVTSHFWSAALTAVSSTATFVATVCGAIIGVITLYRMWHHKKDPNASR